MHSEAEISRSSVVPVLGAASAAVAISLATDRLAVKRPTAALGGAAVALGLAHITEGAARSFFQGAALASIGIALVEVIRNLREGALQKASNAVGAAPSLHAGANSDERENLNGAPANHDLSPPTGDQSPAPTEVHGLKHEGVGDAQPKNNARRGRVVALRPTDAPTRDASASIPPNAVDHLLRIYGLLDERERRKLSAMNATGTIANVAAQRAELLGRSPRDAVAHLRRGVLAACCAVSTNDGIADEGARA